MELTYQGNSCLRLRGKEMIVLLDPPSGTLPGLPKASAGLVVKTEGPTDLDLLRRREGHRQVVSGPGEFEIGGVSLTGLGAGATTIMRIDIDDVRVVAAGKLTRQLNAEEIDLLGHIDVLLLPLGEPIALSPVHAVKLVNALEPSFVVPFAFSQPSPEETDPVAKFAQEMGLANGEYEAQPKLVVSGPTGESETKVIVLESKTA